MAVSKPPISVTICYKITSTGNIKHGHNQLSLIWGLNLLSLPRTQTMTLCQYPGVRTEYSEECIILKGCYMLNLQPCIYNSMWMVALPLYSVLLFLKLSSIIFHNPTNVINSFFKIFIYQVYQEPSSSFVLLTIPENFTQSQNWWPSM